MFSSLSLVFSRRSYFKVFFGIKIACRELSGHTFHRKERFINPDNPSRTPNLDWTSTLSDTNVIFVGTGSASPTNSRGTNSVALRHADGCVWLFDSGEGTQRKLEEAGVLPSKIRKIFITHLHGDHVGGIFGTLNAIAIAQRQMPNNLPPIEIFGPEGIRELLDVNIRICDGCSLPNMIVREICDIAVPYSSKPSKSSKYVNRSRFIIKTHEHRPAAGKSYYVLSNNDSTSDRSSSSEDWCVTAIPLIHTTPCVGYVLQEGSDKRRKLIHNDFGRESIYTSWNCLISHGVAKPLRLLASMKGLKANETIQLPDGSVIHDVQLVNDTANLRKIVLLGDNCGLAQVEDISEILTIMRNADVLITECTLSSIFLDDDDDEGGEALVPSNAQMNEANELERTAIKRGHSTPEMAARIANKITASSLLLNHFGKRYAGNVENSPMMRKIEDLAHRATSIPRHRVAAAHDGMSVPIIKLSIPAIVDNLNYSNK